MTGIIIFEISYPFFRKKKITIFKYDNTNQQLFKCNNQFYKAKSIINT